VRRAVIATVVVVVSGIITYAAGMLLDFEYPYWLTLRRVSRARTWDGTPVAAVLEAAFPRARYRTHWHTCAYCIDSLNAPSRVNHVQLAVRSRRPAGEQATPTALYHFGYDRFNRELVPASQQTAQAFSQLMPPGARFAPQVRAHLGDGTKLQLLEGWPPE
jgi:hypothetical protein